jgi:hypothetical protein
MKSYSLIACLLVPLWSNVRQVPAQGISQDTLPENHLAFTLHRVNGRFEGANEYLEGFTLSIDVPQEILDSGLHVVSLMEAVRHQDVTGTLTYPAGATTKIEYEIVHYRTTEEIYMKTTLGYFLWESAIVQDDEVSFVIDFWYTPPVRQADMATLELTEQLLADSVHWQKEDDRRCEDDSESNRWSLFCALKYASIQMMGEYNHHNTAMNTVRFVIDDLVPDHGFEHQLMDFNNAPSTTHGGVLHVLEIAKERIKQEMEERS